MQLFIKKLRKRVPNKLRYYGVGEYGTSGEGRPLKYSPETIQINPHYHLCIFGIGPEYERQIASSWTEGRNSEDTPLGFTYTGTLTPESAAYVAGYVMKKTKYDKDMYEELAIHPEFSRMSNRPGIGHAVVDYLAKSLKKWPEGLTEYGDVPFSVKYGKRNLPLGGYLREKLRWALDMDRTEQEYYDDETGEITTKVKWHAKEEYKAARQAEMQALQKNPEIAHKMDKDAQVSISHYLEWKNAQAIRNFESRHSLAQSQKIL